MVQLEQKGRQTMKTATVVTHPDGQIVRLPMDIRLDSGEVFVKQVGQSVVLVPKLANPWQPLLDSLDQFSDDFMAERSQPTAQERETIFE
jgi:antitoxin VapB